MPERRVQWDLYQATLEERWANGDSASEIAKGIPGATRCSVLGRIYRKGLSKLRPPSLQRGQRPSRPKQPRQPRAKLARPPKPAAPRVITLAPDVITPTARPWEERTARECHWPFRLDSGVTLACCRPINGGRYCYEHAALAYTGSVSAAELERLARVA